MHSTPKKNEVYVSRNTSFQASLERATRLLTHGCVFN
jgi:hypothetical protein